MIPQQMKKELKLMAATLVSGLLIGYVGGYTLNEKLHQAQEERIAKANMPHAGKILFEKAFNDLQSLPEYTVTVEKGTYSTIIRIGHDENENDIIENWELVMSATDRTPRRGPRDGKLDDFTIKRDKISDYCTLACKVEYAMVELGTRCNLTE